MKTRPLHTPLPKLLKALSEETRLRILHLLFRSGELCVCDIEDIVGGPQTRISRHLAYLRRAGLVRARRQGLWMLYSLPSDPDGAMSELLQCVDRLHSQTDLAKKDAVRLEKNIKTGCCATFTTIKPGEIPVILQIDTRTKQ
jgi:ArsR family transcriptional regulator